MSRYYDDDYEAEYDSFEYRERKAEREEEAWEAFKESIKEETKYTKEDEIAEIEVQLNPGMVPHSEVKRLHLRLEELTFGSC